MKAGGWSHLKSQSYVSWVRLALARASTGVDSLYCCLASLQGRTSRGQREGRIPEGAWSLCMTKSQKAGSYFCHHTMLLL